MKVGSCRALRHPGGAVHSWVRQPLGVEPALGAGGHDDRVLDRLCLDQSKDFGAEVLAPVRPAQAAAGHLAEPQVDAFDARRIDPDFEHGRGNGAPSIRAGLSLKLKCVLFWK